ncbi:MAG TPA: pyruvate kinase, partial [Myxococcales bacterium]|nr:pyruvate kinase [Myxococcales bacterium]
MIRRTKIVATLGPATASPDGITRLLDAGANVIRINASHGTSELREQWFKMVRAVADGRDHPVAILVDLQGPRIRVGELAQPRELVPGSEVVLTPEEEAQRDDIPTTYADLATDARVGARILLNDGLFSLEVTKIAPPRVTARVIDGGELTSHKGMNLPGLTVSAPALTAKDKEDVVAAVAWGADFLALSFVRRAEDLHALRAMVP